MAIDFVTDQLAISALDDAESPQALGAARIGFVLSLEPTAGIGTVPQVYLAVTDRVPLSGAVIERAVGLLAAQIRAGRRVLVHCQMGISRSPAIAVCYLRQCQGLSIEEALAAVTRARPRAEPHPVLLASIRDYYEGTAVVGAVAPAPAGRPE